MRKLLTAVVAVVMLVGCSFGQAPAEKMKISAGAVDSEVILGLSQIYGARLEVYKTSLDVVMAAEETSWSGTVKVQVSVPAVARHTVDLSKVRAAMKGNILIVKMPAPEIDPGVVIDLAGVVTLERSVGLLRSGESWQSLKSALITNAPEQAVRLAHQHDAMAGLVARVTVKMTVERILAESGLDIRVVVE